MLSVLDFNSLLFLTWLCGIQLKQLQEDLLVFVNIDLRPPPVVLTTNIQIVINPQITISLIFFHSNYRQN